MTINYIFNFSLSDKLKFAIKASLSMALAYLIPFSQGWSQASTAAMTVMLIAAMGSVGDSVTKGTLRVIGTVIGATIGMTLIGLFPQEREMYLLLTGLIATVLLYLGRAYRGDMTAFLLSAITLMGIFQNGEVEGIFLYGIDKTYMTILGILIYTFIGIFLWPVNLKDSSTEDANRLSIIQSELYLGRDAEYKERKALYQKMISQEQLLGVSIIASGSISDEMSFSKTQWYDIVNSYRQIDQALTLLSLHDKASFADDFSRYITNYQTIDSEILALFEALPLAWREQKEIEIPEKITSEYNITEIKTLSQFDRADISTTISYMLSLHTELRKLAEKLNSLISPMPTLFTLEEIKKPALFLWFDIEDFKSSIITFMIFWAATLLWIFFNPPGGFMIVMLATGLSVITTFTPVKPSLLLVFSFSFIFATLMYVLVLPRLHYSWELGIFIFLYSLIGFYLISPKISVFFLMGTTTLGMSNVMNYDFQIFLMTLFVFYAFLFLLLFFYYIPFSTKPEHLFLVMKNRYFKLSQILLQRNKSLDEKKGTIIGAMAAKYSTIHLISTVKKMQLWASQIDDKYFDTVDKKILLDFGEESETFVYLLQMMHHRDIQMIDNPVIKAFKAQNSGSSFIDLLGEYSKGKEVKEVDILWRDEKQIIVKIENSIKQFISNIEPGQYSEKEIIDYYENISLYRTVWMSLFSCQTMMEKLDFKALERSRF